MAVRFTDVKMKKENRKRVSDENFVTSSSTQLGHVFALMNIMI